MHNKFFGKRNWEKDVDRLFIPTGGGSTITHLFVAALGGNEGGDITSRRTWMDDNISRGVEVNSSGDQVSGSIMIPADITSIEIYPLLNATGATELTFYSSSEIRLYLDADSFSDYVNPTVNLSSGLNWLTDYSVTLTCGAGSLLHCYLQAESTPTNSKKVFVVGWVVLI